MGKMSVELCGIKLDNPVIPASGTFGFGYEFAELYDINILGTFSFKGTTKDARFGNPTPRIAETPNGMINAVTLAGAFAAQTTLPVIGIPVKSSTLDGLDALLSTVQMPSGMPVATVAIDGSANAALLAAQIIAVEDEALAEKLNAMRKAQHDAVIAKDAALVIE